MLNKSALKRLSQQSIPTNSEINHFDQQFQQQNIIEINNRNFIRTDKAAKKSKSCFEHFIMYIGYKYNDQLDRFNSKYNNKAATVTTHVRYGSDVNLFTIEECLLL